MTRDPPEPVSPPPSAPGKTRGPKDARAAARRHAEAAIVEGDPVAAARWLKIVRDMTEDAAAAGPEAEAARDGARRRQTLLADLWTRLEALLDAAEPNDRD
jgi:hypothetical protein